MSLSNKYCVACSVSSCLWLEAAGGLTSTDCFAWIWLVSTQGFASLEKKNHLNCRTTKVRTYTARRNKINLWSFFWPLVTGQYIDCPHLLMMIPVESRLYLMVNVWCRVSCSDVITFISDVTQSEGKVHTRYFPSNHFPSSVGCLTPAETRWYWYDFRPKSR